MSNYTQQDLEEIIVSKFSSLCDYEINYSERWGFDVRVTLKADHTFYGIGTNHNEEKAKMNAISSLAGSLHQWNRTLDDF